ncbi:translation machinery-associated protein 16 [Lepeophtheirus salmonis]|uniref:translation machinery-associated protein 16 n=1 Tax=Lepeophtheirus salmonis TaxID=72036 RepID=UPI001AE45F75|nr:translation machinery-associated protein 16-like [Lepeophtheirus salmonis]
MAKGKHAPAKGAVNPDKVLHPYSRKVKRIQNKEYRKVKISNTLKTGCMRLSTLGDKLLWFHDNLNILACSEDKSLDDQYSVTPDSLLTLINAYLERFDDEVEAIKLKSSIGKNRKFQHCARSNAIKMTLEPEKSDFDGCGLEIPDLLDKENLEVFRNWSGELRFVTNIKLKKYTRKFLTNCSPNDMDVN